MGAGLGVGAGVGAGVALAAGVAGALAGVGAALMGVMGVEALAVLMGAPDAGGLTGVAQPANSTAARVIDQGRSFGRCMTGPARVNNAAV